MFLPEYKKILTYTKRDCEIVPKKTDHAIHHSLWWVVELGPGQKVSIGRSQNMWLNQRLWHWIWIADYFLPAPALVPSPFWGKPLSDNIKPNKCNLDLNLET